MGLPDVLSNQTLALDLRDVSRHFGALVAVSEVCLQVRRAERRAILGSNGAGKTTLFNLITGDLPVTKGSIAFMNEDITRTSAKHRIRRGLRRTYQISLLFHNLTVRENVYLACQGVAERRYSLARPKREDEKMAMAERLIEKVHLTEVQNVQVETLSHGQQRQLEIALALAGEPKFVLFDEPAAGLSPAERIDLIGILDSLCADIGFIIIEHDMDVALRVAESVTMMHNGKVFKEGTPEEIENDTEVQALYLGHGHG